MPVLETFAPRTLIKYCKIYDILVWYDNWNIWWKFQIFSVFLNTLVLFISVFSKFIYTFSCLQFTALGPRVKQRLKLVKLGKITCVHCCYFFPQGTSKVYSFGCGRTLLRGFYSSWYIKNKMQCTNCRTSQSV